MPFFDKLTSLAQSAVDNTKDMLEVNKLNSAISAEKAKITELKAKIGDYYYAKYASGVALDDEPSGIAAQIKAYGIYDQSGACGCNRRCRHNGAYTG